MQQHDADLDFIDCKECPKDPDGTYQLLKLDSSQDLYNQSPLFKITA
jgi:hypothetical protein